MVLDNGLLKCSYSLCSLLREIGGGKKSFWNAVWSTMAMQFLNASQNSHEGSSNASPATLQSDGRNYQQRISACPMLLPYAQR